MQYTLLINQVKAVEWELTTAQAMVFSFLFSHKANDDGYSYYSHKLLTEALPIVSDKTDTFSRYVLNLERKGLIERKKHKDTTVIAYRITNIGKSWGES